MKKERDVIMIKITKLVACIALLACSGNMYAKVTVNNLNKAFYYVGRAEMPERGGTSIDLGRFVLLFNAQPVVTVLPDKNKSETQETLTLFFPYAVVGGKECKKMVDELNAAKSSYFTFRLEQLEKPVTGLQFSVAYDPKKVGFDQRRLETIKYDRGLEIRMFNKEVLDAIKKAEAPRVASAKKKRLLLTADTGVMILEQYVTV